MGPPGSYLSPNVNWLRGQRTPMADPLPYGMTIEKVRPIFSGRVIRVNVETVRLPNGQTTSRDEDPATNYTAPTSNTRVLVPHSG